MNAFKTGKPLRFIRSVAKCPWWRKRRRADGGRKQAEEPRCPEEFEVIGHGRGVHGEGQ